MSSVGSLTRYVHELRSPDSRMRDEAARIIWERFSPRPRIWSGAISIIASYVARMSRTSCRACSPASATANRRERPHRPAGRSSGNCWSGSRCARSSTPRPTHGGSRDIRRERGDGPDDSSDPHFPKWMLDHVDRSQPSPQERVAVVEEVQRLLRLLPDPLARLSSGSSRGSPTPRSPA